MANTPEIPNTFEDFEGQQRSYDAFKEHTAKVVADAIAMWRVDPEQRLVGFIVEAATPEAELFRQLKNLPPLGPADELGGAAPRDLIVQMLQTTSPPAIDKLDDARAGPRRKLPILFIARTGCRVSVVEIEVTSP